MTLKELVMKVDFNSLRPYLEKFEPEHLDNIYAFREAYDILRRMNPVKKGQHEIHVSWSGGEMEGEEKWISVHPMHEASWEEDLAADVVVADDIHLTNEELAMHCLWEITYWGFSPQEQLETFNRKFYHHKPTNQYEIALDKLEESIWKHQTPRKLRCRGENGERYTNPAKHSLLVQRAGEPLQTKTGIPSGQTGGISETDGCPRKSNNETFR